MKMSYSLKYKLLSSILMSFLMALVMIGCIMASHLNITEIKFFLAWRDAFFFAWPIAFPTAFLVQPLIKGLVNKLLPVE